MGLTSERVTEIFLDCLYREDEDTSNHIKAEGITTNVGFHPERLEGHRAEVEAMLMELPDQFLLSKGGGWSFLNACMDRNDIQWGGHENVQQLILLGIGLNKVRFCMPRSMWSVLPGGMPYFVVLDK